jgi:hypothetical protein
MSDQTSQTPTYPADAGATPYLLSVRGRPVSTSTDAARETHNATAGAPQSVAGARSLGDLSHNVYVGLGDNAGEILFIDIWNSLSGLGQFFGNPQVQEAAGHLFAERQPDVWAPTEGYGTFHLQVPSGSSVQAVGILRSPLTAPDKAADAFSAYSAATVNVARTHGLASHSTWLRVPDPGSAAVPEILGVDTWTDVARMNTFYDLGLGYDHLGPVLADSAQTSIWQSAPGAWVEW